MSGHPGRADEATPAIILASAGDRGASPAAATDEQLVRRHRQMLVASILVLALSLLLQVQGGDRVAFSLLPNWPLPPSCLSRTLFGIDCPGCGLTRSFVYLAHGDWRASLAKHRVGWLLALAVMLQIPYRLAGILGRNPRPLGRRFPKLFGMMLIVVLIGNWVLRMLHV
jgi:hypothetical protein